MYGPHRNDWWARCQSMYRRLGIPGLVTANYFHLCVSVQIGEVDSGIRN